jgi:hypothetical protein
MKLLHWPNKKHYLSVLKDFAMLATMTIKVQFTGWTNNKQETNTEIHGSILL